MEYIPAAYQTPGRVSVDFVAVHWMATTLAGCIATFTGGGRQASAHYGVEDGRAVQFVHDGDTAWALGNWDANQRSISVEHSAQPGRDATDATYSTSISLIADLCTAHGLTPSPETIRPHNHFQNTQCPGTLNLDRIISGVTALMNGEDDHMNADQDRKLNEIYDRVFGRDVQRWFNPGTMEVRNSPFDGAIAARSTDLHDVISTNNFLAGSVSRILAAVAAVPGIDNATITRLGDELKTELHVVTDNLSITLTAKP